MLEAENSSEAVALHTDGRYRSLGDQSVSTAARLSFDLLPNAIPRVNGQEQVLSLKKELHILSMSSHTLNRLAAQGITIKPDWSLHKPFSVEQPLIHITTTLTGPSLYRKHFAAAPPKDVPWFD